MKFTDSVLKEKAKGIVQTVWKCGIRKFKNVRAHQDSQYNCVEFVYEQLLEVRDEGLKPSGEKE